MSWSPVVARRTLSHVTVMVCSAEVAEDANWLSRVVEQDLGGLSSLRRPARKECPAVLAEGWVSLMPLLCRLGALTSPGMLIRLGVWRGCHGPCVVLLGCGSYEIGSGGSSPSGCEVWHLRSRPGTSLRRTWVKVCGRLQPSTKKRALSRASATAWASP